MTPQTNLFLLKKSLSELSEEELRNLMLQTRTNRRTVKATTVAKASKAEKSGIITKANVRTTMAGLSDAQLESLFKQITGGGE